MLVNFEVIYSYYTDIDECEGDHGCGLVCYNAPGTYQCNCRVGYRLGSNGIDCYGKVIN